MRLNLISSVFLFLLITACRSEEERYIVGTWQWENGVENEIFDICINYRYTIRNRLDRGMWIYADFMPVSDYREWRYNFQLNGEILDRLGFVYTGSKQHAEGEFSIGNRIYIRKYTSLWGVE